MSAEKTTVINLRDESIEATWAEIESGGVLDLISRAQLLHALQAMHAVGWAAQLYRAPEGIHITELLRGMDRHIASNFIRYLEVHGVVSNAGSVVRLSPRHRPLASAVAGAQIGFYVEAYGPIVQSLGCLMTGVSKYGRDIERDGRALGIHCATLFSAYHTDTVLRALGDSSASHILDLGCGTGQFLLDACERDPSLRGTGLDISSPAIAEANRLASEKGMSDRVSFVVADAFAPSSWPSTCHDADVVCAVGVVHEHFRDGEAAVVSILNTYGELLRGQNRTLILGEPELRYDLEKNDPDLFLVHIFTAQGFPRHRDEWLDVIAQTKLSCRTVYTRPNAGPRFNFYVLEAKP